MENIYKLLIENLIGILIGFIGVIAAWIFYIKSRRLKEPVWAARNFTIIKGFSSKISGLDIKYINNPIENLSIARIAFWNKGKDTIDISDVASANPINIVALEGSELLDIKLLAESNPSSLFNVVVDQNKKFATIKFDYLDQGQGAVFQIIHTGISSNCMKIEGDIKSAKIGKIIIVPIDEPNNVQLLSKIKNPSTRRRIIATAIFALGIFVPILLYLSTLPQILNWHGPPEIILYFLSPMLSIMFIMIGVSLLRNRVPPSLSAFEDEPAP